MQWQGRREDKREKKRKSKKWGRVSWLKITEKVVTIAGNY
jgi:hypothetical protein